MTEPERPQPRMYRYVGDAGKDPDNNSTAGSSGAYIPPDTRTEEEKRRDHRRSVRQERLARWRWRLRGLLPRGWKDDEY